MCLDKTQGAHEKTGCIFLKETYRLLEVATQNIIHAHPRNMNVRDIIKHAVQSQLWLSTTWLVIQPIQIPAIEITVSAFNLYIHSPTTNKLPTCDPTLLCVHRRPGVPLL